jgi:hypothetical protein
LANVGIDSRSYPTSINIIMSCTSLYSCRGVCLNSTCISSKHTCNPILRDHMNPSPFPSTWWSWYLPFPRWFPSWNGGYFRSRGMNFCLGSFTTSFLQWPLGYGVWIFARLFGPSWFWDWLQPLFPCMWVGCLKSCSTFGITFAFNILTPSVGKTIWKHVYPIAIGDVTYHLVACTLINWLRDIFMEHFILH